MEEEGSEFGALLPQDNSGLLEGGRSYSSGPSTPQEPAGGGKDEKSSENEVKAEEELDRLIEEVQEDMTKEEI